MSRGRVDEEQIETLARRLPDSSARRAIIELCHPLAHRLARRFQGRGESHDDLVQVAAVGLIKAVDNFDRGRGESLVGYAMAMMLGELRRHFRDRSRIVRMPREVQQRAAEVNRAVDHLSQRLGRSPTIAEIAAETDLPVERVLEAHGSARLAMPASIEELDIEGTELSRAERDESAFVADWVSVAPVLADLPPLQRRILYLRFHRGLSQSRVAVEVGVSQVHVSRLLNKALVSLRRSSGH